MSLIGFLWYNLALTSRSSWWSSLWGSSINNKPSIVQLQLYLEHFQSLHMYIKLWNSRSSDVTEVIYQLKRLTWHTVIAALMWVINQKTQDDLGITKQKTAFCRLESKMMTPAWVYGSLVLSPKGTVVWSVWCRGISCIAAKWDKTEWCVSKRKEWEMATHQVHVLLITDRWWILVYTCKYTCTHLHQHLMWNVSVFCHLVELHLAYQLWSFYLLCIHFNYKSSWYLNSYKPVCVQIIQMAALNVSYECVPLCSRALVGFKRPKVWFLLSLW